VTDSSHTFLFADLVGFTALADLEGDSRALAVALELQRRTDHQMKRTRGMSRTEKQERTRDALLRAASRLFCRRGLEGTSIDEITEAAG
jgi:hypothetical protein